MSPDIIVLITLGIFVLLLLIETPVAFALAAAGAVGITLLRGFDLALASLASGPFVSTANYSWAIIPMYILLGMFALQGHMAGRLFKVASVMFRRLPGGLGVATVGACAGFAAISGSSLATAASIGRLSIAEMRRYGYPTTLATGLVAAAATLGILIPPSVVLAMYAVLSNQSVARLLVAGIIPGVVLAASMALLVLVRARSVVVQPQESLETVLAASARTGRGHSEAGATYESTGLEAEDSGKGNDPREQGTTVQLARAVMWAALIVAVIAVGIFSGWFTPIESAAIAALLALVMLIVENVQDGLVEMFRRFRQSLTEAAAVTSMAMGLIIGASIFSAFLVAARVPMRMTEWITALAVPPLMVVVIILVLLVPLGMFLEGLSILIIVVPLVHPVIVELGFDPIWFAILFVIMLEISLITPPVGMNAYVVSVTSRIRVETVFRGIVPFVLVCLAVVAALIAFPDIVTWLPSLRFPQ